VTLLRRFAFTALVLAMATTACGSEEQNQKRGLRDRIEVTGDYGDRPTITIDSPLTVPETTSWTTTRGEGDRVGGDATTILALTLADARTGDTVLSTHDQGQRPLEITLGEQVFPALVKALVGKTADSRVVVASAPDDAYGDAGAPQLGIKGGDSVVMVADVLSTDPTTVLDGPTGVTSRAPATAPAIEEKDGLPAGFDFRGLRKPKKFAAIVLREGTGPVVEDPDRIAADYVGQVWGAAKPFDSTFGQEPAEFSIGMGNVLKAWDRGLTGLREGARVMLICPPALAYGSAGQPDIPSNSTLVFLVDVLGVG
jgi:peptidylprolyl isomerase